MKINQTVRWIAACISALGFSACQAAMDEDLGRDLGTEALEAMSSGNEVEEMIAEEDEVEKLTGVAIGSSASASGSSQSTATDLGEVYDDEDWASTTVTMGSDGTAWMKFHGNDTAKIGPVCNPGANLYAPDSNKVCIYVDCDTSLRKLSCPSKTKSSTATDGSWGCCTDGAHAPNLTISSSQFDCKTTDDSAEVYIKVSAQANTTYELEYRY